MRKTGEPPKIKTLALQRKEEVRIANFFISI
jgi:hypothetical protein